MWVGYVTAVVGINMAYSAFRPLHSSSPVIGCHAARRHPSFSGPDWLLAARGLVSRPKFFCGIMKFGLETTDLAREWTEIPGQSPDPVSRPGMHSLNWGYPNLER